MLVMIDNYDSFTYNLVQYFGELKATMKVFRNDEVTVSRIRRMRPEKIVISPGPGRPEDAGISVELIKAFAGKVPLLGVCLGHQSIGYAFGGKVVRAKHLMHGKTSKIAHNGKEIFRAVDNPFLATRYHSLVLERKTLPDCLAVIAETLDADKEIMAIRHKTYPLWGLQFHPESILTAQGKTILYNFLQVGKI